MSGPIRVALAGARGRMGTTVAPGLLRAKDVSLVAEIEAGEDLVALCRAARAEVVVDFTTPESAVGNARKILEAECHGVIGTTGFTSADLDDLDRRARAAGKGLLVAPNFALGAVLMQRFASEAARHFPRAEVVEYHHDGKKDAPSGTALDTARRIAEAGSGGGPEGGAEGARGATEGGVHVHSVRLPGFVAHQEVLFGSAGEILTIRHDATSRDCYVAGVLAGVRAMAKGDRTGVVRGLGAILFP